MSAVDAGVEAAAGLPVAVEEPLGAEAGLEEFAELAGLAVELLDIGEERTAMEVLALACAALRDAVRATGVEVGEARLPPPGELEVVPITELARAAGAEGLYRLASSAVALAADDPAGRGLVEAFLEAAGVPVGGLSDRELAATALGYLALSIGSILD
ncbi:MAG: hypothetical protein GSR80_000445 [Desulfurococcales archaeon]|nr:hypothetical protein [Desulfurococcales archaeon]